MFSFTGKEDNQSADTEEDILLANEQDRKELALNPIRLSNDLICENEAELLKKRGLMDVEVLAYSIHADAIRSKESWSDYDIANKLRNYLGSDK